MEQEKYKKVIAWEVYKNVLKRPRTSKKQGIMDEPFIMTKIGPFKVPDELSNPIKAFTLFTGHTNFIITEELAAIIENTLGVEVLDILSPYRFRIAIGKMFQTNVVKNNIVKNLDSQCLPNITQTFLRVMNDGKETKSTEPNTE